MYEIETKFIKKYRLDKLLMKHNIVQMLAIMAYTVV